MYCNSDSLRFSVLCIGLLAAFVMAASVGAGESAEPPGRYSRYSLSLADAGEAGEPLSVNLHSRDGEIRTGWASVGHETGFIRDHQLRWKGERLSGRLAVDVGPLQYVCDLEASAAGDELAGTYTGRREIAGAAEGISGTASGRLSPRAAGGDLQVLLHLWSMYTEFGHIRNPDVEAIVRDGRISGGKFEFGRKVENRGRLKNNQPLSLSNNLLVADTEGDGVWIVSPPGGSYGAGGAYHLTVDLQPWSRESEATSPPMLFDRQGDRVRFRTEEGRGGSTHGWKGAMRAGGFRRLIGHRVAVADNVGYGLMDPTGRATRIVWATESTAESRESIWQLSDTALSDVDSLGTLAATPDWVLIGGGTRDGSSGDVFVVDCRTGEVQQVLDLPARVVECGLAIADGKLYAACENGVIRCFHAKH